MDLAIKKIELINWLTRQDESMIRKIDELRKSTIGKRYAERMDAPLSKKVQRAEASIQQGRTFSQEDVEALFQKKFDQ